MSNDLNKKVTTETEIGSNGVGHSKMHGSEAGVSNEASAKELTVALEASQKTIQALTNEINKLKEAKSSDSSIDKLTAVLSSLVTKKEPVTGPSEEDNLNRATDFQKGMSVDGRSLMEAQQTLAMFRNEKKVPISIAKFFQDIFGPSLAITVNGCRVAIPCDGKTYYINETHAEHARERMAKVDRRTTDNSPEVIETEA